MMPELGGYAVTVLGAYGVTLTLLVAIVALSWLRATRVARALAELEARMGGRRDGEA